MIVTSTVHGVPEAPHLQDRDLEAFRAQWLIIESIAVAGSSVVQICIQVKSLAITTSCEETKTSVRVPLHSSAGETAIQTKQTKETKRKRAQVNNLSPIRTTCSHGNNWKPWVMFACCLQVWQYDQIHSYLIYLFFLNLKSNAGQ